MSNTSETADKILSAALSCAQRGRSFSMADIAQSAGLSRQTVYLHFPDRAGLMAALLARFESEQAPLQITGALSARAGSASSLHIYRRPIQSVGQ